MSRFARSIARSEENERVRAAVRAIETAQAKGCQCDPEPDYHWTGGELVVAHPDEECPLRDLRDEVRTMHGIRRTAASSSRMVDEAMAEHRGA